MTNTISKNLFYKAFSIKWFLIITILHIGCATPGNIQLMVPQVNSLSKPVISYSVSVSDVSGGGNEKDISDEKAAWRFVATNEEFRQALLLTLRRSNLFKSIGDNNSDLELRVGIKHQEISRYQKVSMFECRAFIKVAYEIIDRKSGHIVWKEAYLSEAGDVQTGAVYAAKAARENSVKESLECFVNRISSQWPQISYNSEPLTAISNEGKENSVESTVSSVPSDNSRQSSGPLSTIGMHTLKGNAQDKISEKEANTTAGYLPNITTNRFMPGLKCKLAILPIYSEPLINMPTRNMYNAKDREMLLASSLGKVLTNRSDIETTYSYYHLGDISTVKNIPQNILSEASKNDLYIQNLSNFKSPNLNIATDIGKKLEVDYVFMGTITHSNKAVLFLVDVNGKTVGKEIYEFQVATRLSDISERFFRSYKSLQFE